MELQTEGATHRPARWPALPLEAWRPTRDTLHRWTRIVGKVQLALAPPQNHWWHVPLRLTGRGLTTGPLPWRDGALRVDFDLHAHELIVAAPDGRRVALPLEPRSVAHFHREFMATLSQMGVDVHVWPVPVEVPDPIPFDQDEVHRAYDADWARRFHQVLALADFCLERHRSRFLGKSSPVHFFWGSFDLALSFFSGRPAPPHPGVAGVARRVMCYPDRLFMEAERPGELGELR